MIVDLQSGGLMDNEIVSPEKTTGHTAGLSKTAFGMLMITVLFVVFCKVFQIYPPKHIFKWIFVLPPFAFVLSVIALFIKDTNRILPVITIVVVMVFEAPVVVQVVKTLRSDPIFSQSVSLLVSPSSNYTSYRTLHNAIGNQDLEEISMILNNGGDPNSKNGIGQSALERAIETGNAETVKLLLAGGAKVNASTGSMGQTALLVAAFHGNVEIANLLVRQGATIEHKNQMGMTPAFAAALSGQLSMLTWLHNNGANLDVTDADGRPIIHRAGSAEVLTYLVENGIDIQSSDKNGNTILHSHVTASVVRQAIKLGADLDAKNNAGLTPMETAHLDSVKKALREGRAELEQGVQKGRGEGENDFQNRS